MDILIDESDSRQGLSADFRRLAEFGNLQQPVTQLVLQIRRIILVKQFSRIDLVCSAVNPEIRNIAFRLQPDVQLSRISDSTGP